LIPVAARAVETRAVDLFFNGSTSRGNQRGRFYPMIGRSLFSSVSIRARKIAAIGAPFLVIQTGARVAVAEVPKGSVIVVEISSTENEVDQSAMRATIGDELGVVAIAPSDPRAKASDGTIRVRLDASSLEVEYDETRTIRRRVPAPVGREATRMVAAFLAGNLARHEGADLAASLGPPVPTRDPVAVDEPERDESPTSGTESPPLLERLWFGAAIEGDVMPFDNSDTFLLDSADNFVGSGTWTNPSGLGVTGRFLVGVDAAISQRFFVGLRLGIASARYPGSTGSRSNIGRFHIEGRVTYVFDSGAQTLAPFMLVGFGAANFDAEKDVNYIGPMQVWKAHGFLFASTGLGIRIPFAPNALATIAPLKATLAFPLQSALIWSPEVATEVRF
jgi:hypothetical protein